MLLVCSFCRFKITHCKYRRLILIMQKHGLILCIKRQPLCGHKKIKLPHCNVQDIKARDLFEYNLIVILLNYVSISK